MQAPEPDEPATPGDPASSEPSELSRFLLAQIDERMKESLQSAERQPQYYVIRSPRTGVLSVLASSTLGQDQDIVLGPCRFSDCIAYVNAAMVAREAVSSRAHKAAASAPPTEESP